MTRRVPEELCTEDVSVQFLAPKFRAPPTSGAGLSKKLQHLPALEVYNRYVLFSPPSGCQ